MKHNNNSKLLFSTFLPFVAWLPFTLCMIISQHTIWQNIFMRSVYTPLDLLKAHDICITIKFVGLFVCIFIVLIAAVFNFKYGAVVIRFSLVLTGLPLLMCFYQLVIDDALPLTIQTEQDISQIENNELETEEVYFVGQDYRFLYGLEGVEYEKENQTLVKHSIIQATDNLDWTKQKITSVYIPKNFNFSPKGKIYEQKYKIKYTKNLHLVVWIKPVNQNLHTKKLFVPRVHSAF